MASEIRIYTINRGQLGEFVRAWQQGIYPLRVRHGFTIEGAWILEKTNQFVWILSHAGDEEAFFVNEAAYYESTERGALDPDPQQYIARVERWFVKSALPPGVPPDQESTRSQ